MKNNIMMDPAYLTAIAAIVAPVITTLITCVTNCYLARLSNSITPRLDAITSFSHSYSSCQYGPEKIGYMKKFYEETSKLIPLCRHHRTRRNLLILANEVNSHGANEKTDKLYQKCLRLLSREI